MSLPVPTQPIPVTILTGFLGAGKTTLLNRIIRGDHGLRVAVMVNDFGAINIDNELIVDVEGESVSLANGCICCTIRDDLLIALLKLLTRPEPPEYVLIEASGVSDPVAIAMTFLLPELRPLIVLDGIVTVVDAEQVFEQRRQMGGMIEEQIQAADMVVLNKIDLASAEQRQLVQQWITSLVPRARILAGAHADVPLELLLGVGRYRMALEPAIPAYDHDHDHHHHHDHSNQFMSWSYHSDQPLDLRAVRETLKQLPITIMRAKGIIWVGDAPTRRLIVHVVGKRIAMTIGAEWGDQTPATQLVAIATPGGIDRKALTAQFEACQQQTTPKNPLVSAWEWVRSHQPA
jgi:G3E family GTPase